MRDSQIAGDFTGANAVLAVCNQPDGSHPLVQRQRGILKDGSDFDRELAQRVTVDASPDSAGSDEMRVFGSAMRAGHAVRPDNRNQKLQADVGIGEVPDCL